MENIAKAFATVFGVIVIFYLIVLYTLFSEGFVALKLWNWFLLPIFPNLPHLIYIQMIGIILAVAAIKPRNTPTYKVDEENRNRNLFFSLIAPWVALLIAYVVHTYYY